MNTFTFNDGESFDVSGPLRIEKRADGYYVLGENFLCAVDTEADGRDLINEINQVQ